MIVSRTDAYMLPKNYRYENDDIPEPGIVRYTWSKKLTMQQNQYMIPKCEALINNILNRIQYPKTSWIHIRVKNWSLRNEQIIDFSYVRCTYFICSYFSSWFFILHTFSMKISVQRYPFTYVSIKYVGCFFSFTGWPTPKWVRDNYLTNERLIHSIHCSIQFCQLVENKKMWDWLNSFCFIYK